MSTPVLTLAQICKDTTDQQHNSEAPRQLFPAEEMFSSPASRTHMNLHAVLRYLAVALSQNQPLGELLHTLVTLITQAIDVDLCVVLLQDSTQDTLTIATCVPDLRSQTVQVQPLQLSSSLLEKLTCATRQGELPCLHDQELEALNPLKNVQYKTLLPVPLMVGTSCLGIINCYSSQLYHYNEEEHLMLCLIAGQTALMLKNRQRLEEDVQTQRTLVKAFLSDLLLAQPGMEDVLRRRAYALNFDMTRPHVLVQLECAESIGALHAAQHCAEILKQIAQHIQHRYSSSLVDERPPSLFCLLCLDEHSSLAEVQYWFAGLVEQLRVEQQIYVSVGLSNACTGLLDYHKAGIEASDALQIGASLAAKGSCFSFQDLGAYRYLYQFAQTDTLHDQYQEQIELLVAYDQRKKTNLLDTLEIYLESGGNAARTSNLLDVHRNTLLQRLERIQKLCSADLEQVPERLPLLLALKVYRLRSHFALSDGVPQVETR